MFGNYTVPLLLRRVAWSTIGSLLCTMSTDAGNNLSDLVANYRTKRSRPDIILLHEATLTDLLECNNPAAYHLLRERNKLLRER